MARDWDNTELVQDAIFRRMGKYGENVADIPYTVYQERREDGLWWLVQIHVKVPRVTEFDIEGEGRTVAEAMRSAYLALNNEPMTLQRAEKSNLAFGVAV